MGYRIRDSNGAMAGYVLIVESDPDLQRKISDALRDAGFDTASEAEAAWARRSIAVRTPDAVILGIRMADRDGFRLADELRSSPDTRETPIVFIATEFRGASHRAEARRRFAPADYLETPINTVDLIARLPQLITPVRATGPALPPVPVPPPRDPDQQRERRDVERSAKRLDADAELRGTLKRTPFAHLLQKLYSQGASGSLLLLREETKKIVGFVDGYPVSVRSNVLGECLGQILLQQKLITGGVLAASLARMQKEKRHQGEILVEMGVLSPFNLQRALVEQVEAKLFEIFTWRDGNFMFKAGAPAPDQALRLNRPPAALILEGIRRHYDSDRQDAVLGPLRGHHVRLSPDPILRLQEMTSDPVELAFIRSIDGSARLQTILDRASVAPDKARLLLVALSEAGMVGATEPPRRKPASSATPIEPPTDPDVPTTSATAGASGGSGPYEGVQLSMVALALRSQSHFWALGVDPTASAPEIERAYETLARRFHADRYRGGTDEDRRLAKEIFDHLGEAYGVLRDPVRRRHYAGRLEKEGEKAESRAAGPRRKSSDSSSASMVSGSFSTSESSPSAAVRAIYDAGMDHLRARRHHDAVEAFRQAARLAPGEADFRAALGWALFREAPADARAARAALAELRRAVQLDNRNRQALQYLAQFYQQTAQPDLAIRELEKILQIDPAAEDAADELRRLRDGR